MSPRQTTDRARIQVFLRELGRRFPGAGRVYLVGGTTMVYEGVREQTLDIDLTFEVSPEGHAIFVQAVRDLKEELSINVEEVSPADFIPLPQGYKERCTFVGRYGQLDVFHFDLYSVALSKIERGTEEDFADVLALLRREMIAMDDLVRHFRSILPLMASASLKRDADEFERKFLALHAMHGERTKTAS